MMPICVSFLRPLPNWDHFAWIGDTLPTQKQIGEFLVLPYNVSPNWEAMYTTSRIGNDEPKAHTTCIPLHRLPTFSTFCDEQGHMKRNCPKLPPQQSQKPREEGGNKNFDYQAFGEHIRSLDLEEREQAVGEFLSKLDFQ